MKITEDQFWAYENVRRSGVTNMFDIRTVMELSGLSKEQILYIMEHYGEFEKEFVDESEQRT